VNSETEGSESLIFNLPLCPLLSKTGGTEDHALRFLKSRPPMSRSKNAEG